MRSIKTEALVLTSVFLLSTSLSYSGQNVSDGLVSYWPLDTVVGDKTPDLVSGYDLSAYVGGGHTLTNANAIKLVAGYRGNCVNFTAANQVLLGYIAGTNDDLPINKNNALTISFWANGAANQTDVRLFSEGKADNNNPLFNIGSNAGSGGIDMYERQQPTAAEISAGFGNFGNPVNHVVSTGQAFDNTWHHVAFIQQEDGSQALYIDGEDQAMNLPAKLAGKWNLNATSIGGILRSSAGAWVTAKIDEVALWKRALSQSELDEVRTNGLNSVFPPLANGLVSHWPLDVVIGDKTPDVVSGYDLSAYVGGGHTLTNAKAIKIVQGYISNCVNFTAANQVLLGYIAGTNDDLPINKNNALTISFWANGAANQTDVRLFSEGKMDNNNPLFNIGSNAGSGGIDMYERQQPTAAEISAGFGNFGNPVNHVVSTGQAFDNTWHHVVFVQQEDGTQALYIDGEDQAMNLPVKLAGKWNLNATSIGGILRSSAGAWVTAKIDDAAVWKRALSVDEINQVRTNGVPQTFTRKLPLQIRNFATDRSSVGQGDSVVLKWEASPDAALSISPGIGNVTAQTQFGVGSTSLVVNATTTFTITATRGSESTNAQTTVNVVTGIAPGWRLLDNFNFLSPGHIGGQGNWINALNSVSGAANPADVLVAGNNKVLTFEGAKILAATPLNSLTILEGQSNTMFCRFYIDPAIETPSPDDGSLPDLDLNLGLTDKPLRDVQDFRGGNNGPSFRLIRQASGAGGPIDLTADNGVNNALGGYSYLADSGNNPNGNGLETGKVYNVWMDIQNLPFDVVAGVQNGGDLYSLSIQKEGDTARKTLFQGFLANRDAINIDTVLGAPTPNLTQLFFAANDLITPQGTNVVRFDDFFISGSGPNATVPVAASSFVPGDIATPVISLKLTGGGQIEITWTGNVLESSSSITTGWAPVQGATKPYVVSTTQPQQLFFRAKQ
ncbi:MAG TPA: LamG domain-containing protein [Verrucomicrobiae bacterium]|nr:LamG domain-containing protein [Verrucomicrobiae bacterium]